MRTRGEREDVMNGDARDRDAGQDTQGRDTVGSDASRPGTGGRGAARHGTGFHTGDGGRRRRRATPRLAIRLVGAGLCCVLTAAGFQASSVAEAEAARNGRPALPRHRVDKVKRFVPVHGQAERKQAVAALDATEANARQALAEQRDDNRRATAAEAVEDASRQAGQRADRAVRTAALGRLGPLRSAEAAGGEGDGAGDYSATPLSPSSTWSAGGSAGSFTWSYPMRVPATAAGPAPELSLSYDSGSVDGRTPTTNNQSTWVGEGFGLSATSFVERSYASCDDEGVDKKDDRCWKSDNATLTLNGATSELVRDADDTKDVWHLKNDDGSRVERLTGADNGARNGEHWRLTTGDGTQYLFGLEKLPGADADTRTNSVWTVPVFGDDEGDPCHKSSFADSSCTQAWRWNLDYVVDTHGNAETLWYAKETNNYARNGDADPGTKYVRGGYLKRIDYGQRADALFTSSAPQRVTFTVAERCTASGDGCDELTKTTKGNWPDVPFDAICADGKACTGKTSPTFFTRKRLTGVTTQIWDTTASTPGYRTVDSWKLDQTYLDPGDIGDATDQVLWLKSVQHANAAAGTTEPLTPPVRFAHAFLVNRVDATDDILRLTRPRIGMITTETGAVISINYSDHDCVRGKQMPEAPDSNDRRCMPVKWNPNGVEEPILDWFHKYVVTAVIVSDPVGGAPTMETSYSYQGDPAWHHADDPISKAKYRTWSQWRGYGKVTVISGSDSEPARSRSTSIYLRGMHGDKLADGGTRSVKVTGIHAGEFTDADQYAGFERETVTYNGVGGAEVSGTISTPWSRNTATRTYPGAAGYTARAYLVRTSSTQDRTVVTSGKEPRTRTTTTTTSYDELGMATSVEDAGDDDVSGDETCERTWYARNPGKGITSLVSRSQTLATRCKDVGGASLPADSSTAGDVISDTATAYDMTTWSASQTPTLGDARWTGRVKGYSGGTPSWQTVSTSVFDALGRVTSAKDAAGTTTTTTYTPAGAGIPVSAKVIEQATDSLTFITTTYFDPLWGRSRKIVDTNNKITEQVYDDLGRLVKVWLPTQSRAAGDSPSMVHSYRLSATTPSWSASGGLRGDGETYSTTYTLYDAHLRSRQVQTPSSTQGRIISETFYDARGQEAVTYADVYDAITAPSGTLMATANAQAPAETRTTFDGAGRAMTSTFLVHGDVKWSTTTSYTGDSVATTAGEGGSAAREITNALGQVVERRQYAGTRPTGEYLSTTFAYTPSGEQAKITGPGSPASVWTYGYDLFGRRVRSVDPDRGTTTTAYTAVDQVDSVKDARGKTILYAYDRLGRKTSQWLTARTDATKVAGWTYDTVAKGQLTSSTRYVGGVTGDAYTKKVTAYDNAYRPTGEQLLLPDSEPLVTAGVPATLSFTAGYNRNGTLKSRAEPAVAGLPKESITPKYTDTGLPVALAGATGVVQNTVYSPLGLVDQLQLGRAEQSADPRQVWITNTFEDGTKRLKRSSVTDGSHAWMAKDVSYGYDEAGNVTSVSDAATMAGAGKSDHQCFTYDGYQRLTEAWTPASGDCTTTGRNTAALGGAAPYWTSYTYDDEGLRTGEVQHIAAGDITTSYTYDPTRTHRLTGTSTKRSDGTTASATYTYDATGNTLTRPGAQGTQSLTWDGEGRLTSVTEPATDKTPERDTGYVYDADGGLLIRRTTTGDGDTILYLGATEIRLAVKGTAKTLSAQRYYSHGDTVVAVRSATLGTAGTKLTWMLGDAQGTVNLTLASDNQAVTKRYSTPFGAPRGTEQTWVDDKAFLGRPTDPTTGLTHLGAREYDPAIGRFLSVDPELNTGAALSLNGYSYTENNPVTLSDPSGLSSQCNYPAGSYAQVTCSNYYKDEALREKEQKRQEERERKQAEKRLAELKKNIKPLPGTVIRAIKPGEKFTPFTKPKTNWQKFSDTVNTVYPYVAIGLTVTGIVLAQLTPVGWVATAVLVVTYTTYAVDAIALTTAAVDTGIALNEGRTEDALWNAGSMGLTMVGYGAGKLTTNALRAGAREADIALDACVATRSAARLERMGKPYVKIGAASNMYRSWMKAGKPIMDAAELTAHNWSTISDGAQFGGMIYSMFNNYRSGLHSAFNLAAY
ncbi:MAG: RHS repeat-associated core domain-containing protein [Actinomycetales bacterium]|nr:RHS repeat-associated core domain-containing protein [Actinomycetales bacterium]